MCARVPFCLGTDCKSLYDLCVKVGSMPDERRVALDLLDVREGIEEMKDQIRWVPTDHMLADAFTKSMPPDLLLRYLHDGKYSFKYDDELKNTKRAEQKARSEARKATITKPETIGTTRIQKAGAKQQSVGLKVNCCMWTNVLSHLAHPTTDVNWVS